MKRIVVTYLILSFMLFDALGQKNRTAQQDSLPTSMRLFYEIDFSGAIRLYKQMILFDPKNPVNYYKLGFAYLNTKGKADSALYYFNKATLLYKPKYHEQINKYSLAFYRAYAYLLMNQIDSAARLAQWLQSISELPHNFRKLAAQIEDSLHQRLDNYVHVSNLGKQINSEYTEHSPIFDPKTNTLLFTSRRPAGKFAIKYDDGQYDENIFVSQWDPKSKTWSEVKTIPNIDTIYNQATCSYNPQNNIIIIYKDNSAGDLYWAKLINGRWTTLHKYPKPINSIYEENHATITSDGKTIYFSAYRPNGYGGTDIWMSKLLPDGTWSKPINLGPNINTAGDEDAPYITPDGKYLYFSSTGHNSLGGYDIFVAEKDEFGQWDAPKNLGYPINSIYDDIFFYPIDSATAFFASNRPGGYGNADIYRVDYLLLKKNYQINICYLQGFSKYKDVTIKIADFVTGKTFVAKPNESGKFIFVTKPYHKYKLMILDPQGQMLYQQIITSNGNKYKYLRQINLD